MAQNYNYPSSSSVTVTGTPNGAPIPSTSLLIAGENIAGNQQVLQTDASGNLLVALSSDPLGPLDVTIVGPKGAQLIANSVAVAISSDQTVPISAVALPLPAGASTSALQTQISAQIPATLGQKTSANSLAVVIASDQGTLPLPTGASTSALQTTGNASLASIDTKTPALGQALAASSVPVVLTAAQLTTLTPLTSVTVTQATGTNLHAVIDSGTVTANIGTTNGLALDASVTGLQVAQGSTTSGQKGGLSLGAVTTAAPSYTTAQSSPLSLTTAGALRVDASATTQPVSGTVNSKAATPTALTVTQAAISVGTTAVRLTVSGSAPASTRVVLVATPDTASTATFYIGSSSVTNSGATMGIAIVAGQSFIANSDAGDYYIISSAAAQSVLVMEQA